MRDDKKERLIQALERALEFCKNPDSAPIRGENQPIIAALYNGNLYPAEDMAHRPSVKHQKLAKLALDAEEQLLTVVGRSNASLVEALVRHYVSLNDEQSNECYAEGFQDAIQLLFAGLSPLFKKENFV